MAASDRLRLRPPLAFCKTDASVWVAEGLRRLSAPGCESNNGDFSVTKSASPAVLDGIEIASELAR